MSEDTTARPDRPNRRAVSQWTLEQLYDLIFTGDLPAGATVREALRQLEVDGLLNIDPATGRRRVASYGPEDIYELYTVRSGLEVISASHAAPLMTAAAIEELKSLQAIMDREPVSQTIATRRDFGADIAFHRTICKVSGLNRLMANLTPMWVQTQVLLRHLYAIGIYNDPTEYVLAYRNHNDIIDALERHDPALAADAVHRHLHDRRDQLIMKLKAVPTDAWQDAPKLAG
jgi:DNA-binding GntR family transcriptional regulator